MNKVRNLLLLLAVSAIALAQTGCSIIDAADSAIVGNPYVPGLTSPRYQQLGVGTLTLRDGSRLYGKWRKDTKSRTYDMIPEKETYATYMVLKSFSEEMVVSYEKH